jgi:hypothetical protein
MGKELISPLTRNWLEVHRQCVFKLRWSKQQRDEYVAQHFGCRRFYQLTLEEQRLLVYRLRTRVLAAT